MRVAKSRPDMTEVGNAPSDDGISISIDTNAPPAKKNPRCKATLTAPVFSTAPPAESSGTSPNATVRRDGRQPRKRTAPVNRTVDDYGVSARDQKLLRMALAKSLVETTCEQREHMEVPTACVFHPTLEEFADPIRYISSVQQEAQRTGICKIVPPHGWKPPFAVDMTNETVTFDTRRQKIHRLQEGVSYDDGRVHTFKSYQENADAFRNKWLSEKGLDPETVTSAQIEDEYWRIIETGGPEIEVEYANDLDTTSVGSGFYKSQRNSTKLNGKEIVDFQDPEYYASTAWNLNNLPDAPGSLLRHVHTSMKGINVPWLYCGMLFATFCWHTEDNYMYSVNYQHLGAKKRWYGIPSAACHKFETTVKNRMPERFRETPDLLFHLTTMVSPSILRAHNVPVFTLVQEPGDIVLTFPKAYHGGFSEGFNCNEAVNFLLPNWIQYSRQCIELYRMYARHSVFSHDRFIFHFASTQRLEEYTAEECDMLLEELRLMFREERDYKNEYLSTGLTNIVELSAEVMMDEKSMEQDDFRQCYRCNHHVFFSGVTCPCNPARLSCLRHVNVMCQCPMSQRTLFQWVSSAEFRYAIRRVQLKIHALKAPKIESQDGFALPEHVKTDPLVIESVAWTPPKLCNEQAKATNSPQKCIEVIDLT